MHPQIEQDHPGNCPICGMTLEPKTFVAGAEEENTELRDMTRRFWIGAALSVPVFILAMWHIFPSAPHWVQSDLSRWAQFVLSTPVVLWCGWPFFQRGWQSIVNRSLNMFTLIAIGVGAAYFYSAVVMLLPQIVSSFIRRAREDRHLLRSGGNHHRARFVRPGARAARAQPHRQRNSRLARSCAKNCARDSRRRGTRCAAR